MQRLGSYKQIKEIYCITDLLDNLVDSTAFK